jgi:hypothetical protein
VNFGLVLHRPIESTRLIGHVLALPGGLNPVSNATRAIPFPFNHSQNFKDLS